MIDWLGNVLVALTVVGCAAMLTVVVSFFFQVRTFLALRSGAIAEERQRLERPLPPDEALPHVVVQLPTYNEGAIVERAIANAVRLDWPKDKLHVQVCDDSTDGTTAIAQAAAQQARDAGFDVVVLHRGDRTDFKAGALRNAMAQTEHGYFAILDVDYVSSPDFLRQCMTVLLGEPKLAFVQARLDFLNANENLLTRAQTIMLDFHYGLEQPLRSWSGQVVPFNGTCGIWRRDAIEAGDGWHGDTVTEDWDLSYRAWLNGWRGIYVTSVTLSGELPTRWRIWKAQQRRWASGIGQVALKMSPAVIRERGLTATERLGGLLPLALWVGYLMFAVTLIFAVAAALLKPAIALPFGLGVYAVYLVAWTALLVVMLVAMRSVGRKTPLWRYFLDFQVVPYLILYICWENLRSVPATLLGRQRSFVRTPKRGSLAAP